MKKIMWVKSGWSDYYRGGPVDGNFRWFNRGQGEGHEAFNFMASRDGTYYCYVPPHGAYSASPSSSDADGWTVVCLAKFPSQKGIHVVGWYENATLMGKQLPRPEYDDGGFRLDNKGEKFTYTIKSDRAFLVPPETRTKPFSHPSVRQGKFSYLSGPGVAPEPAKAEVLEILLEELARVQCIAIEKPDPKTAPDELEDGNDPLIRFGTPEHRRKVELAAEGAVTAMLEGKGYSVLRRSDEKIGYDLQAIPQKGRRELYVEVKGTSGADRRFFMTPNERNFAQSNGWRLAVVTDALNAPIVTFFTYAEMNKNFSLQPMCWIAHEVKGDLS